MIRWSDGMAYVRVRRAARAWVTNMTNPRNPRPLLPFVLRLTPHCCKVTSMKMLLWNSKANCVLVHPIWDQRDWDAPFDGHRCHSVYVPSTSISETFASENTRVPMLLATRMMFAVAGDILCTLYTASYRHESIIDTLGDYKLWWQKLRIIFDVIISIKIPFFSGLVWCTFESNLLVCMYIVVCTSMINWAKCNRP